MKLKYTILTIILVPLSIFIIAYTGSIGLFKYIGIGYTFIEEKSFDCVSSNKNQLLKQMRDLSEKHNEEFIIKKYLGFTGDKSEFEGAQFGFCYYGGCYELYNIYDPNVYRFSYINNAISIPFLRKKHNIDFKKTFTCEKYGKYGSLG